MKAIAVSVRLRIYLCALINTNSIIKDHLLCLLTSGAFLFRTMAPVVGLVGGTFFSLVPPRGAFVRVVDFKIVPPLVAWLGGGMIARGASKITLASFLANELSGTKSTDVGMPSRL